MPGAGRIWWTLGGCTGTGRDGGARVEPSVHLPDDKIAQIDEIVGAPSEPYRVRGDSGEWVDLGEWLLEFCPDLFEAPTSFGTGKVALWWD